MPIYQSSLYNERLYNGALVASAVVYSEDLAVFVTGDIDTEFSLCDLVNTFVENINDSGHRPDLVSHPVVRGDGVEVTDKSDREKIIIIDGWLEAADAASLETLKDDMRRLLSARNGYLDLTRSSVVRRWEATVVNQNTMFAGYRGYMINWCPYQLQFFCRDYGGERSYTSTSKQFTAAAADTMPVSYEGSADGRPVCVIVVSAASSITAITIGNDESGISLTLTNAIAAGDVIIVDGENKTVTLNGTRKAYTGAFPDLVYGDNNIRLTATGTSITQRTTVLYRQLYR